MQLSEQQAFNQSLIKMAVLLYKIDGKITLTEQDYLDEIIDTMEWESPISVDAFLNDAIYQVRQVVDADESARFLRSLQQDLNINADRALEVAMNITGADGERCDEETELLSLLTHKILAKALTQNVHSDITMSAASH